MEVNIHHIYKVVFLNCQKIKSIKKQSFFYVHSCTFQNFESHGTVNAQFTLAVDLQVDTNFKLKQITSFVLQQD